jgi:hypothetical protein
VAKRPNSLRLHVFLNGRLVGALTQEPSGAVDFVYADEWLTWENNLPVSRWASGWSQVRNQTCIVAPAACWASWSEMGLYP